MSDTARVCSDMVLPWEARNPAPMETMSMTGPDGKTRAIMPIAKRWPNGTKLSIRFIGGTPEMHEKVKAVASEWMKHANIEFSFDNAPGAAIRIGFVQGDGSWSYVGTDNLDVAGHARTMNFGWALEDGTILHEFGHMLGLAHEHSNPEGGIQWNEPVVIDALSRAPNFWDEAKVRHNVLKKYSVDHIHGTSFDKDSIMLYAFPASWTLNGVATKSNDTLSDLDKQFIASMYPKSEPRENVVQLPVNVPVVTAAAIKEAGEEDLFSFEVEETGEYSIETQGNTDVVMKLFAGEETTNLITEDDDSGDSTNARIETQLDPGKYTLQVRHYYQSSGTGDYGIVVNKVS